MDNKKTIYAFIGLPASGKGTQAEILAKKLNIAKPIGMGDLIREVISGEISDPFVAEIKKRYDDGVPQPDSVAIDLLRRKLDSQKTDIILDNFPFTQSQAEFLNQYIEENSDKVSGPVIIYVNVAPEVAIKRVTMRKVCSGCGAIYGGTDEMICEKCGGSLIVRTDDNIETVKNRINHYQPKINEVIDFYKNSATKIIEINGEKPVEAVTKEIDESL